MARTPRSQKRDLGHPLIIRARHFHLLRWATGRTAGPSTTLRSSAVEGPAVQWSLPGNALDRPSPSAPEAAVKRAVLDGFRYVAYGDCGLCVEISNGASDLQYPVMRSRTQALLLHRPLQKTLGFR